MLTVEDAPWVMYMDIDEKTGKRFLKTDTPEDIKEKYAEHLKQVEMSTEKGERISK